MGQIRYILTLLATLFLIIVKINLAPLLIRYFLVLLEAEYEPRRAINFSRQFESPTCLVSRWAFLFYPLKDLGERPP